MNKEENVALLIDADNISAEYISIIISEATEKYGSISIKRAYGDWTTDTLKPWKAVLSEFAISPIQQFAYTSGKNSTDSAMIIDAMDILYSKDIDIFCLATSDCDFTRLASRLRESGKFVVGMGESKAVKSFTASCNEFKYLDVLSGNDNNDSSDTTVTSADEIRNYIISILQTKSSESVGRIKQLIVQQFSDFDERNYGYTKFSTFLSEIAGLETDKKNNTVSLVLKTDAKEIKNFIVSTMKSSKKKAFSSAEIQNMIAKQFKDFRLKDLGYSNMKAFLKSENRLKMNTDSKYSIV